MSEEKQDKRWIPTAALCFVALVTFWTIFIPAFCGLFIFLLWAEE